MTTLSEFAAYHTHGFVRVAAATPLVAVADPAFNAEQTIALARDADRQGVDLLVFPELGLSSYAIDDLHLQDALLDAVEAGLARDRRAPARDARAGAAGRRAAARTTGGSTTARVAIRRGRMLGVVPKSFLPNYREYLREALVRARARSIAGSTIAVAGRKCRSAPT